MDRKQMRDLTVIGINGHQSLVIACDSSGSIGNKDKDCVKVLPEIVGYFTAHVALAEILAIGAEPISLINTLSVEMSPTGEGILQGIRSALERGDLTEKLMVTGSTEENFPTVMTGMGITVIGLVNHRTWVMPKSMKGDLILVLGLPKVGEEVRRRDPNIINVGDIKALRQLPYVREIVPVGSKGIDYEVEQITKYSGLTCHMDDRISIDIDKSAGPATCAVVTIAPSGYKILKRKIKLPIHRIGQLL